MKSAATRATRRRIVAGVLAATALVGATGCSTVSPVATAFRYHQSDGVNVNPVREIGFRNVAVVAAEGENPQGRLIGSLDSRTPRDYTATVTVNGTSFDVEVPADEVVNMEPMDGMEIPEVGAQAGEMVEATITARGADGKESTGSVMIPVLSGALPEYREFVPGGADAEELTKHLDEVTLTYGEGEEGGH